MKQLFYNYSKSTFRIILSKIEPVLIEYNLTLELNPINISGDEGTIRKFFMDFYYIR